MLTGLRDGLYQVTTPTLCAGFVIAHGRVTWCAPILRSRLTSWLTRAIRIAVMVGILTACSTMARDQAITACRQVGYLSAVEDGGLWYCWKGPPLSLPKPGTP